MRFNLWKREVVLGIIGIAAILAFPQLPRYFEQGKVVHAKNYLVALRKAEGAWFARYSAYTADLGSAQGLAKVNPGLIKSLVNDKDWFYTIITSPESATDFIATATRKYGPEQFNGLTITIDRMGRTGGTHQLKAN